MTDTTSPYPADREQVRSDESNDGRMPFLDHLEELRRRLLKSILAVVVMACAAFYFSHQLFLFLIRPLGNVPLYFTQVTGSFYAYLKVCLIAGFVAAVPVLFYQLWMFLSPGLYRREKTVILPLVASSTLLFVIGAAFCYLVTLPIALKFLTSFQGDLLRPIITIDSYLSFAGLLMLASGLSFQLPIIGYFLGRMGIVTARGLSRGRRYAILTVAGILTPPDVFTQVALTLPLYALFEITILVVYFTGRKRRSEE